MREIKASDIALAVEALCMEANYYLGNDIVAALKSGLEREQSPAGRMVLEQLCENAGLARDNRQAICQDTGMAVVFVDVGQEVHISGGSIASAINEGVRKGYSRGYLRNSVVGDPIERINTGDNTPAVIHYDFVEGDRLKITVAPKGFGSENMSSIRMLKPSDGIEGVRSFILEVVDRAGPNPCPPVMVGVGMGGTFEKAALLAKKALLRPVGSHNDTAYVKRLEEDLLEGINRLGIGPAGLGGRVSALAVNIEVYPTHIAGLPVAVNIGCHATRHAEAVL